MEVLVADKVLELADEMRVQELEDIFKRIEHHVQNGVAKALGG